MSEKDPGRPKSSQSLPTAILRRDATEMADWCKATGEEHGRRENRLRRSEAILVWLTTVAAGLSSLSLLSEIVILTAILSILTVLLAGTNAALKPSQRASEHKETAAALFRLHEKLWSFANLKLHSPSRLSKEQVDALIGEYEKISQERVDIVARGPYIEPFERPGGETAQDA